MLSAAESIVPTSIILRDALDDEHMRVYLDGAQPQSTRLRTSRFGNLLSGLGRWFGSKPRRKPNQPDANCCAQLTFSGRLRTGVRGVAGGVESSDARSECSCLLAAVIDREQSSKQSLLSLRAGASFVPCPIFGNDARSVTPATRTLPIGEVVTQPIQIN
jgi:hypothetical protein